MILELYKDDLVSLVKGIGPKFECCIELGKIGLMDYVGGFDDSWHWKESELNELTEERLYEIYQIAKANQYK